MYCTALYVPRYKSSIPLVNMSSLPLNSIPFHFCQFCCCTFPVTHLSINLFIVCLCSYFCRYYYYPSLNHATFTFLHYILYFLIIYIHFLHFYIIPWMQATSRTMRSTESRTIPQVSHHPVCLASPFTSLYRLTLYFLVLTYLASPYLVLPCIAL